MLPSLQPLKTEMKLQLFVCCSKLTMQVSLISERECMSMVHTSMLHFCLVLDSLNI